MRLKQITYSTICFCIIGCGGGTTGTSPTDSFKLLGVAKQANGAPASSLSMTVRSSATDEPLVDSGTDAQGKFSMDLPAEEQSLVVDVTGVGQTRVNRNQRGSGAMATTLSVTTQGSLETRETFEAQVVPTDSLCEVVATGTTIQIARGDEQEPCIVNISVASQDLPLETFQGILTANCGGSDTVLSVSPNRAGSGIQVNLQEALIRSCIDIKIQVSSTRNRELVTRFLVEEER